MLRRRLLLAMPAPLLLPRLATAQLMGIVGDQRTGIVRQGSADLGNNGGASGAMTRSYTTKPLSNLLVVSISGAYGSSADNVTGVTFNGAAMIQAGKLIGAATGGLRCQYLYYLFSPSIGTYNSSSARITLALTRTSWPSRRITVGSRLSAWTAPQQPIRQGPHPPTAWPATSQQIVSIHG